MPEKLTPEGLIAQAKESLLKGLSISPIEKPLGSTTGSTVTYLDIAMTAAGTALYKTARRKTDAEKATAIVISALVHYRLGCLTWAVREITQAKELIGSSFVNDLVMELTSQPTEMILR